MYNLQEEPCEEPLEGGRGDRAPKGDSSSSDHIFSIDHAQGLEPLSKALSLFVRAGKGIGTQGARKPVPETLEHKKSQREEHRNFLYLIKHHI